MNKFSNTKGYTLVEVLVSVAIMLIFLPFAASMITNSNLLASYSKHKIQAAYAAEQIIENQRQNAFLVIAAGHSVAQGPASVILDTKGNYVNPSCNNANIFCGTATVVATPASYTNTSGVVEVPPSTTVDHFVVTITWVEQILKLKVPMTETYAEDIVNDPMLN